MFLSLLLLIISSNKSLFLSATFVKNYNNYTLYIITYFLKLIRRKITIETHLKKVVK